MSAAASARSGVLRFGVETASDYYDATSSTRETDWQSFTGAVFEDYHFTGSKRRLALARLRRETRNNPYLAGLVGTYAEALGHTSLRSRTRSREYNLAKERYWYRWGKRCTVDGHSWRHVEKMIGTEDLLAGELFVIQLTSGKLQLVASELCGSPAGATRFGDDEINGIVYDPETMRPRAYRFGRLTRYGSVEIRGTDDELVDARYVCHYFDPDRILMGRGLPRLLACGKTARDLYEITRAKTKQIKDVTHISGAIEVEHPADYLAGLAEKSDAPDTDSSGNEIPPGDQPADEIPAEGTQRIELAPGTFVFLNVGEKLHQLVNEYKAEDYKELIMLMLHAIASPVGLPVELWFSGLGDVNYSGFKGLGVQWKRTRESRCATIEENHHNKIHFWRVSKAHNEGDIVSVETGRTVANPQNDDDLIEWGWRRTNVIDDEKAAKSNETALKSGDVSHADVWRDRGEFPEEILAARRQLYIDGLIAAGELPPDATEEQRAAVKVPLAFLYYNEVPGRAQPAAAPSPQPNDDHPTSDARDPAKEEDPDAA